MTAIGFTGTRNGMTDAQRETLRRLLKQRSGALGVRFHHGACVGSDAQAAEIARELHPRCYIVAHPGKSAAGGSNGYLDAHAVTAADEVRETQTHFARNRNIVNETELLIATPMTGEPITAKTPGGTAYTVTYARRQNLPVYIILPDGQLVEG